MRLKATGAGPAGYTALVAVVLALAVAGLLVAGRGLDSDGLLADGDASGHYKEPARAGDAAADAMRSVVHSAPPKPLEAAQTDAAAGTRTDGLTPSKPLVASDMPSSPAVGPLFYTGQGEVGHGCTASVVHSDRGDLIATAAHCVHQGGFRTDITFVPGYHDGVAPYGVWVPTAVDIDPAWAEDRDPDHDVAFLRVRPVDGSGPIERVTGAERIRFGAPARQPVRVLGYPSGAERTVGCQNSTVAESATQLRFDCEGLPNGTSGSPFLADVDATTGLGTLVGVLGGKDEGGDDETSYAAYFGAAAEHLYRRATG